MHAAADAPQDPPEEFADRATPLAEGEAVTGDPGRAVEFSAGLALAGAAAFPVLKRRRG
jgi:hypothetical protein